MPNMQPFIFIFFGLDWYFWLADGAGAWAEAADHLLDDLVLVCQVPTLPKPASCNGRESKVCVKNHRTAPRVCAWAVEK